MTDQAVLAVLLPAAMARTIDFHYLQPAMDRTSVSGDENGGWLQVLKWCQRNPPQSRRNLHRGLNRFSASPDISFKTLLVQLDTDICERPEFQETAPVIVAAKFDLATPRGRGQYVAAVLAKWLWPKRVVKTDEKWTVIAPAVEAIETWLIAGLTQESDPETNRDPFAALQTWAEVVEKRLLVRKKPERYQRFARRAAREIEKIVEKCPHFAALVQRIERM
ncbi:MAG: hypothetical protein HQM03_07420 [Magnetococcales bacterium]|nr:hypothetical protein [Magnetococcales bacterium]